MTARLHKNRMGYVCVFGEQERKAHGSVTGKYVYNDHKKWSAVGIHRSESMISKL